MLNLPMLRFSKSSDNANISATAINDISPGAGSIAQRIRLCSGLVLMSFVFLHYINHALGNISLEVMNQFQTVREWIWQTIPGSFFLYGALIAHIVMAIWKLISRKSLRLPAWEWVQILLGLLIPYFLLTHILAMRGTMQFLGIHVDYQLALAMMWPGAIVSQNILLLVTWVHGCIGLHFWLRIRKWYSKHIIWYAGIAILLPALALTGWTNAARHNAANLQTMKLEDPESANQFFGLINTIYSDLLRNIAIGNKVVIIFGIALALVIAGRQIFLRMRERIQVDYGDGKIVASSPGSTLLEVSRNAGIPHMSVCGGRARCSTCRTLILQGADNLGPVTDAEAKLLARYDSAQPIRLACQAVVNGNVKIRPLMEANKQLIAQNGGDRLGWGVERSIAILFLDIRGFSRISEKSLPYDVVYILNSFFGEVTKAVEANDGYVDKFMGDGMMALFGLSSSKEDASRNAIRAAIACQKATVQVSGILKQHLSEPINIGIGVHTGDAVIGRIGKTSDQVEASRLTAIGDSVNVSARLEQATKEFSAPLVISSYTADLAGLENLVQFGDVTDITVRNISRPVSVIAVRHLDKLEKALG